MAEPDNLEAPGLHVTRLSAWHVTEGRRVDVFKGLSFRVGPGEIVGVFGPNGCGKTTLLRSVLGVHRWRSGEVVVRGSRERISSVPQDYRESFFAWASLRWNLTLSDGRVFGVAPKRVDELEELKRELGIDLDLNLRPPECSGGMVQQAALLRAVVADPGVLVADEPFAALDVAVARRVRRTIRRKVRDKRIPTLVVMHDLEALVDICDRVLVISEGRFSSEPGPGFAPVEIVSNQRLRPAGAAPAGEQDGGPSAFADVVRRFLSSG